MSNIAIGTTKTLDDITSYLLSLAERHRRLLGKLSCSPMVMTTFYFLAGAYILGLRDQNKKQSDVSNDYHALLAKLKKDRCFLAVHVAF